MPPLLYKVGLLLCKRSLPHGTARWLYRAFTVTIASRWRASRGILLPVESRALPAFPRRSQADLEHFPGNLQPVAVAAAVPARIGVPLTRVPWALPRSSTVTRPRRHSMRQCRRETSGAVKTSRTPRNAPGPAGPRPGGSSSPVTGENREREGRRRPVARSAGDCAGEAAQALRPGPALWGSGRRGAFQALHATCSSASGTLGPEGPHRRRRLGRAHLQQRGQQGALIEGRPARQQGVEDGAQGVDVAVRAGLHQVFAGLLGRHVSGSAQDRPLLRGGQTGDG